jgi:3-mercaptopyruvate sulfurtransferase SseA/sterol desaturase/sphingolipid hydroxylase (fatty acid hydroxylase superfamily)
VVAYLYPISLAVISAFVAGLERLFPWRRSQVQLRPRLWSDFIHLVFNGHFLGVLIYAGYERWLHGPVVAGVKAIDLDRWVFADFAAGWPVLAQVLVALFAIDFCQWCVHNVLHRVPALWKFHQVHHSVVDGELDWIVSFRFHWMEVIIYKAFLYVPLAFFGFGPAAIMTHAIFGTLIGHLNHANLDWDYGPLKVLFNNPRMHLWHHDYEGDERTTVNFGIIFSCWDYLFGTAKVPSAPPARIGYDGVTQMPPHFFGHALWPLRWPRASAAAAFAGGVVVGVGGLWAVQMLRPPSGASSQPAVVSLEEAIHPPVLATEALRQFGGDARERGYARPDTMVSALELARALGSPRLVLLDVRPADRFEAGHIPTARAVDRPDYSVKAPIPGLSRGPEELQDLLRSVGVDAGDEVVLYGDGGPEPYRLWWTLSRVAGVTTRVLDGGLPAYKELGRPTASGTAEPAPRGTIDVRPDAAPPLLWSDVSAAMASAPHPILVDTRSEEECRGEVQRASAQRAGRIPGSILLPWREVQRQPPLDQRLRPVAELQALFREAGLTPDRMVTTYCQSGTRSSATWFALLQAGHPEALLLNYDGSWAEYSRLSLPLEIGPLASRP